MRSVLFVVLGLLTQGFAGSANTNPTLPPTPLPEKDSKGSAPAKKVGAIMRTAAVKAIGGGRNGAIAGAAQVISLMWLRTIMNYQVSQCGVSVLSLS